MGSNSSRIKKNDSLKARTPLKHDKSAWDDSNHTSDIRNEFDYYDDESKDFDLEPNQSRFKEKLAKSKVVQLKNGRAERGSVIDDDPFSNFRNLTHERDTKIERSKTPSPPRRIKRLPLSPKKTDPLKADPPAEKNAPTSHKKSPTKSISPRKKKASALSVKSPQRRHSDVSVLELGNDSPEHFRKVRDRPTFSKSLNHGKPNDNTPLARPRRARSSSPAPKRSSPPPKDPPHLKRYAPNKKRLINHSIGSSNSFTNIALVKSATQSVDSTVSVVSNFGERTKIEKFKDKQDSLRGAGLDKVKFLNNHFMDQKINGVQTFEKAKHDLVSDDWATEIKGLEVFVSLARDKPEILRADMKQVVRLLIVQLKNLRSQVCRTAAQATGELFFHLGKAMEVDLEKVVAILLQRAADTNKFIRESCAEALDVLVETVTLFKALETLVTGGANHKSVVIRSTVARLMDKIVNQMGAERVMGSSNEFQEIIFQQGAKLLKDSGVEVRKYSKHMFAELVRHQRFETTLEKLVKEEDRRDIKRALDSLHG
ncbi:uncharacterized protein LOC131885033 [Tigriopus californicus]|uniref:uncharacterized protein LOC131885033 n=1 Tax=Tigriopus californicus TaxID=6832 RepID=UPI0027DA4783|nr:uncharacterized protein LOC131885033 [Tigriopus californicus]